VGGRGGRLVGEDVLNGSRLGCGGDTEVEILLRAGDGRAEVAGDGFARSRRVHWATDLQTVRGPKWGRRQASDL
jgi:hypothetical protein